MKRLFIALVLLLSFQTGYAALAASGVWNIMSAGSVNNSGYFNPDNANMLTDATATSATGNAPVISSASYNFVAGDVGAWVFIKAGTNWTPGWYQITSVAANAATVNAAIGAAVQITNGVYHTNTVAGVATVASPTGGTFTCDYSQQSAVKQAYTDLNSTGSSTTLTSATGFTPVMVGNAIKVTSTGTGGFGIVGWYEIVSYTNATTVVTDITTNSGTAMVNASGNVGGSIAAIGDVGSTTARLGAVAGNYLWVQADAAYSLGASDTFSVAGTAADPVKVIGYKTVRSDGYQGRNISTDGKLVLTNMPNYQYQAPFRLTATSGTFIFFESINFSVDGAGASNPVVLIGTDSAVVRCVVTNPSTNTAAIGISSTSNLRAVIFDNDVFMTGASGGATGAGILATGASARIIANRVQMSQSSSTGPAIEIRSSAVALRNTVIGAGGLYGIYAGNNTTGCTIDSNTVVGFDAAVSFITGISGINVVTNNMLTDNTTYAINATDAGAPIFNAYNRLRDPITINGATDFTSFTSYGNVTTDGSAYSDYVDQSTGDYRLLSASPATSAALPARASMGALQRNQTGGGGQVSSATVQ